jgi:IS30 family transposase
MGHNQMEVANCIGVDKSTISREMKRNPGQRGYLLKQAHGLVMNRRRDGWSRISMESWAYIEA